MIKMVEIGEEEIQKLKETYDYNPLTGEFTFKVRRGPKLAGSVAGTLNKGGYVQLNFNSRFYTAHRLAFVFMEGRLPLGCVDHIDRDRSNNRWDNLRDCTATENNRNRSLSKNNTSGVSGVSFMPKLNKWQAYICHEKKVINLGHFHTLEDAALARKKAEEFYGYAIDNP